MRLAAQQRQQRRSLVAAARFQRETSFARSGRCSRNQSSRCAKPGQLRRARPWSSTSTANSGISPTIERTRSGGCCAVGQVQDVVEELVLVVPQADAVAADVGHRLGDVEEVLEELGGDVLVDGLCCASSSAMRIRLRQYIAIQRCRRPGRCAAGRQRRAAVEDADVVEAEEAALEDVAALARPCGSPTR